MVGEAGLKMWPRRPGVGEPAPFFAAATDGVDRYSLDVAAGRWIVLMVFGSLADAGAYEALHAALVRGEIFNGSDAAFFGVSVDPADREERGLVNAGPGVRFFWDFDAAVARLYGCVDGDVLTPAIFLIDPAFRIAAVEPIQGAGALLDRLAAELAASPAREVEQNAPVLTLPRILEPELCQALIEYYRASEDSPSGFARDVEGRTVLMLDPTLKRRRDVAIDDQALVAALGERLETRLFPMVKRTLGWQAEHVERYLICRYGAEDRGFFSRHRDDATAGTAHRKFAVSLNLNDDFDGGELRFPEFGSRTYRSPAGGATVFCCSLLHEATPVERGERYAFVPFLYDDEGARIRERNMGRVAIG